MVMGINSPLFLTAFKALHTSQARIAQSLERLSTGKQLNRAADDPSGLRAVDNMRLRRVTIDEQIEAADRANAIINIADGAMSEINSMLIELKGMVTSAANESGLSDEEREAFQEQADSILNAIDFINTTTEFNDEAVLGSAINVAGTSVVISSLDSEALQLSDLRFDGDLNFLDGDMEEAGERVDQAISTTTNARAHIGTFRRTTVGSEINVLRAEMEATLEAESDIVDADFAKETAELAQAQILEATAMAALEIAQDQVELLLDLLTPAEQSADTQSG